MGRPAAQGTNCSGSITTLDQNAGRAEPQRSARPRPQRDPSNRLSRGLRLTPNRLAGGDRSRANSYGTARAAEYHLEFNQTERATRQEPRVRGRPRAWLQGDKN